MLEAPSEQLVVAKLREMGYLPVAVEARTQSALNTELKIGGDRVKPREVAVFSRQLATMINAGVPLMKSLAILSEQTEAKGLTKVIASLRDDVERGVSLSQAMARHPKVFPRIYLSLVRAGETGGLLDKVMLRLATSLEKQIELRRKIKSAMSYPVAVAVIVTLIVIAMLLFVVPMFEGMYQDLGGTLPLPTRILIGVSDVMTRFWYFVAALSGGAVFGIRRWIATEGGRARWDAFKLRIPVFGKLIHKTAISRFTRTLSELTRSAVPIIEALDIVAETAGNAVVGRAVSTARDRVRMGESLADSLAPHKVFPPMVVQMIGVGEESGALDDLLERVSEFYDQEIEATVDGLTSLIEPMLMVLMGVAVGGMIVALYMPMFNIINLVK
jgi:type IV pilus assembly protein PilC